MKFKELLIENQITEKTATRPRSNAISSMAGQLTQPKKEAPAEKTPATKKPRAISTAGPGAGAFNQMATQLSGNKPNTMANAPVSASNKAKSDNPNLVGTSTTKAPSFAGPSSYGNTTTGFKAPAEKSADTSTKSTAPEADKLQSTPASQDAVGTDPKTPTATDSKAEKPGLLQRIGKGFGDLATGFKQGYTGNYDKDTKEPAAATGGTPIKPGASSNSNNPTTSDIPKTKISLAELKAKVDKLDKKGKQRILGVLKKDLGIATPAPATTTPAVEKPATTTTQPSAGASDIETAARAAAAKPGFQRTASDNLAIKKAKEQGIKIESKKSVKKKTTLKESKGFQLPFSLFKK